jgi:hypothetical protein
MKKPTPRGWCPTTGQLPDRLPPSRAFLVQLPAGDLTGQPTCGRVEHVQSGRSTRFQGLERLAEFFAEVLADDETGEQ